MNEIISDLSMLVVFVVMNYNFYRYTRTDEGRFLLGAAVCMALLSLSGIEHDIRLIRKAYIQSAAEKPAERLT